MINFNRFYQKEAFALLKSKFNCFSTRSELFLTSSDKKQLTELIYFEVAYPFNNYSKFGNLDVLLKFSQQPPIGIFFHRKRKENFD